jgi:hypothetical protein
MNYATAYCPKSVPTIVWREVLANNNVKLRPKEKKDPAAAKAWWDARQVEAKTLAAKYQKLDFLRSRIGWKNDPWIAREIAKIEETYALSNVAAVDDAESAA